MILISCSQVTQFANYYELCTIHHAIYLFQSSLHFLCLFFSLYLPSLKSVSLLRSNFELTNLEYVTSNEGVSKTSSPAND